MPRLHTGTAARLGCLLGLLVLTAAEAEPGIDFSGKTIEWIIPFQQGGGSDTWARFNAPFFTKYLPGHPVVVVRNIPGGGSTKGANRYAATAKPDGLAIFGTSASTQFPYLLGDPRVKYDYERWDVLMVYPTGGVVYTTPKFGISDAGELARLEGERLVYGSQGTTSLDLVPLLAFKILGLDVKAVFGMRGRGAGRLAFERGEATIDYQTSAAYIRNVLPLVERGEAVPLFTWGALNDAGELVRDPAFPDLPHIGEVYESLHGEPPSGIAWDTWFAFNSAGFGAQKLLVVPKGTPREIIETYQNAIRAMKHDPDYLARKASAIGVYEQVTGEMAERLYAVGTHIPEEPRQWVRNWLREEYDLNIL
jgi:tripartite-type tricarboxylate transporter receptor subunit TctC